MDTKAVSGRAQGVGVDDGAVAADDAALLEPFHALVDGRGRQSGGLAQLGVRHAAVTLQQPDDLTVEVLHERKISTSSSGFRAQSVQTVISPSPDQLA